MGRRRRNLPFLPTCGSPSKTLSFRAAASTAVLTAEFGDTGDMESSSVESVIRGLSTDRFFFDPGKTSSILEDTKPKEKETVVAEEKEKETVLPLKENVSMMEMESTDPFVDFKRSMQEMAEADVGLKEWENLQELLSLYLAVNDKINHGYIIGAFVDFFLVNMGSSSSKSCSCSSSSSINRQEHSVLTESADDNKNKLMMISSESPESALSFTSSFASSSGTCSSASNFLSSCSLEDEDDDEDGDCNNGDDEDNSSLRKASVSDYVSSKV